MQWSNVGETEILIEPTKTRDSSGAKIAVEITPDIKAVLERARAIGKVKSTFVFHTLRGMSTSAIKSAWRRARDRAGVTAPWFRDPGRRRCRRQAPWGIAGSAATRRRMHGRHY